MVMILDIDDMISFYYFFDFEFEDIGTSLSEGEVHGCFFGDIFFDECEVII